MRDAMAPVAVGVNRPSYRQWSGACVDGSNRQTHNGCRAGPQSFPVCSLENIRFDIGRMRWVMWSCQGGRDDGTHSTDASWWGSGASWGGRSASGTWRRLTRIHSAFGRSCSTASGSIPSFRTSRTAQA